VQDCKSRREKSPKSLGSSAASAPLDPHKISSMSCVKEQMKNLHQMVKQVGVSAAAGSTSPHDFNSLADIGASKIKQPTKPQDPNNPNSTQGRGTRNGRST
jgi:hypothetical protein